MSRFIEFTQFWSTIVMIAFLTCIIFLQVILRYFFNNPIIWIHEVSSGLLIWATFMGAAVLTKKGEHLRVDVFINTLSIRVNKMLNKIIDILLLVLSIILIVYSFKFFPTQAGTPMGVLQLPRSIYFALPVLVFSLSLPIYLIDSLLNKSEK